MTNDPRPMSEDPLRAQPDARGESSRPTEKQQATQRSMRILIVDDLKDAADALAVLLRIIGHDVRVAYDGLAALAAAAHFCPQIILLDIALPRLDGLQVAEQLRQQPTLQNVCLIAVSGYGQASDIEQSRKAGFDHHLLKPVGLDLLNDLIREEAARHR